MAKAWRKLPRSINAVINTRAGFNRNAVGMSLSMVHLFLRAGLPVPAVKPEQGVVL